MAMPQITQPLGTGPPTVHEYFGKDKEFIQMSKNFVFPHIFCHIATKL